MRAIAYGASALALMAIAAPAAADTVPFVDTTPGPTTFTAPETGVYDILAFGGHGGESGGNGGFGAEIGGDFRLTAGEVLSIVVGGGNGPCRQRRRWRRRDVSADFDRHAPSHRRRRRRRL